MKAHKLNPRDITKEQRGWATTESIRTSGGQRLLPKGGRFDVDSLARISEVESGLLHLIELEDGDLHEDDAGRRVCEAVVGQGVEIDGPHHSRFNLNATQRGLLRIDIDRVHRINGIGDLSVFTLFDWQAVNPGKTVAGVKATPIVVSEREVEQIEAIARESAPPILEVLPFIPRQVFVIATEDLHERLRARFIQMVSEKINWYGSDVIDVVFVDAEPDAVETAFRDGLERGANLFLAAGGNTLDPLDPIFLSLPQFGAEMVHFGAPADPGSMFWVAQIDDFPILNLASCSMYSQATVIDLIMPLAMARLSVTAQHVIRLGYGGLLEDDMGFRFPDYAAG